MLDEKSVFNAARKISDSKSRDHYLQKACGKDTSAFHRIRELLSANLDDPDFLEGPPEGLAPTRTLNDAEPQAGECIGPYKLLQAIGEGGMGTVYMAEQSEPVKRRVALKVIKPGMDSKQVLARFDAERQALAMMDHPNIARLLDVGTTRSGRPYFVMELVKGIPITEYCDSERLTVQQRLELFTSVCNAV